MSDLTKTVGLEEMAAIVGRKVSTVRGDVTRRPESLPPRLMIPNSRLVRWRLVDVERWLADRAQKHIIVRSRTAGRAR